ncbi:MAG: AbrB/MazE/SpoVT family DNA-binding domain-containing protein [Patescibacteria group bacterium]
MYNVYTSTLTSKGQATIPAPVRRRLGFRPGQKIIFAEKGGNIYISSAVDLSELRGSLKPKVKTKYSDKKADETIGRMFAAEYAKTR